MSEGFIMRSGNNDMGQRVVGVVMLPQILFGLTDAYGL